MDKILLYSKQNRFAIEAGKPINLRICCANFVLESYKRTLNDRRKILESALLTIFKPREKRSPREVNSLRISEKETPAERRYQNTVRRAFVWTPIKKIIL